MTKKKLTIKEFIIKYRISFILVFLFTFLLYSIKLFHYSVSIDTELIINDYDKQMMIWDNVGRFSIVLIKFIFHLRPFNYYISISLMILFFSLAIYLLYYIFYYFTNHEPSNTKIVLFSFLIISSPILAEQFYFTLQCAEVAFTFIIFDLVIYFYFKYLSSNKVKYYIFALILFVFCLGTYQSFLVLFISLVLFYYVLNSNIDVRKILKSILFCIIFLLFSVVLYQLIIIIINTVFSLKTSNYLTNQIYWFNHPWRQSIRYLIKYFDAIIFGKGIFYNFSYILSVVIIIINIMKNKKSKLYIFINILCILSPFALSILLGQGEPVRAQFTFPLLIACILIFLNSIPFRKGLSVFLIVIIIIQSYSTFILFRDNNRQYNLDVELAHTIMERIGSNESGKKIIFIGQRNFYNNLVKGEAIGSSFFYWDGISDIGVNSRAIGLINTLGYQIPQIDNNDYMHAYHYTENNWKKIYRSQKKCIFEKSQYYFVILFLC